MLRPKIQACQALGAANIKLVEDPPGPPVLATLAFEIYGSDKRSREILAEKIQDIFKKTEGVVDTDILGDKPMMKYVLKPDFQKAAALGVSVEDIAAALMVGGEGVKPAVVLEKNEKDPIDIFVRLDRTQKTDIDTLLALKVPSRSSGELVSIKELVTAELTSKDKAVTSKDLREVTIVTGEMDKRGSVYAQFEIRNKLFEIPGFKAEWDHSPRFNIDLTEIATGKKYHIVMDGEWKVTFDTFRDLGSAFGVAVLMIYLLMVAYYKSFRVPGIVTSAIPLTLIGIMFGHAVMNVVIPTYFTATSMIGFIALAGIVVRNTIMLIDFTDELIRRGKTLENAIIEAAAIRFRPILLTALAIALASFVIVLDPVWNGLAVSLIFGVMIATILTLVVTPLMYWRHLKNNPRRIDDILNERP
jgi:multidrug efflux pump subunit AcrB